MSKVPYINYNELEEFYTIKVYSLTCKRRKRARES